MGGAANFLSTVTITGNNVQAANARVCASAYYGDGSNLTGISTSIEGNISVNNVLVGGTLTVVGAAQLGSTVTAVGAATFKDAVSVSGGLTVGGAVAVSLLMNLQYFGYEIDDNDIILV